MLKKKDEKIKNFIGTSLNTLNPSSYNSNNWLNKNHKCYINVEFQVKVFVINLKMFGV